MPELSAIDGEGLVEDRVELIHGFGLRVLAKGWGAPFIWAHDAFSSIEADDDDCLIDFSRLAQSRRLIRYDAVGHGRSAGVANPSDHRWDSRGDDLLQLSERLGLAVSAVGGFSTGAATALWAAHLEPDRVDCLVLCGLPNSWPAAAPARGLQGMLGVSVLVGLAEPVRYLARHAPLLRPPTGTIGRYHAASFRRILHTPRSRYVAALVGAARSNLPTPQQLSALDVPTLVLAHRGDPFRPVRTAARVVEAMPNAHLVVADDDLGVAQWTDRIREFLG